MVCPSTSLRRNPSRVWPWAKPVPFRCYLSNVIVVTVKNDQTGIVPTSNSSDTLWIINWNRAPGSHKYLGSESARKVGQLFDLARLGRIPDCKMAAMQRIPVVRRKRQTAVMVLAEAAGLAGHHPATLRVRRLRTCSGSVVTIPEISVPWNSLQNQERHSESSLVTSVKAQLKHGGLFSSFLTKYSS